MTAPNEVKLLAHVWRQWQDDPDFPFAAGPQRGYCVNGTRVVIEVLRHLGIRAKPISVGLMLFNRPGFDLYKARVPITDWPEHAHSIGIAPTGIVDGLGWDGHLIAEGDGWMLDISASTLHRPGRIISPGPRLIEANLAPTGWTDFTDEHGQILAMERRPENNRWRHAPGWKRLHDDEVAEVIRRMAGVVLPYTGR